VVNHKRICSLCHAVVPDEWDTEEHYGTCPECKRLAKFIIKNKELRQIEKENEKKEEKERERNSIDLLLETYNVFEETKSGTIKIKCVPLAKLIIEESNFHFHTIEDSDTGKQEIFFYEDGYYHKGGENRIKELVDYYLDSNSSITRKNEVVDYIKHQSCSKRRDLEPPTNLINLKNGIYNIDTDKLESHNPDYYFLQQLPFNYNKKADCPNIKKFFEEVLYKKDLPLMQEVFGFLLYRNYFLHKAILFLGGGRNGKGTTINLMSKFVGYNNYSTVELHQLIENRFAKINLYGKLANFGAETSAKALNETGIFKNLTGGEPIYAEPKGRGGFSFTNYAKLIFNANHMPYAKYDKSFAFFQRWLVIVFPETFEIGGKKTNPRILEKLVTDDELSGLFNWAIVGLKRIIKNWNFSQHFEEDEVGERFEKLAYPEYRFIDDYLELIEDIQIEKEDVYKKYEKWARERAYPVITPTSFTRALKKHLYNKERKSLRVDVSTFRKNGKVVKSYKNVNWKYDKINEIDSQQKIGEFIPAELKLKHLEEKYK